MPRLRYSAKSTEDILEIASYIARDKPIAARNWVKQIKAKCQLIAKHPMLGDERSSLGNNVRSTYVGQYVIYFRGDDDFVEIDRVIRGDRDIQSL